MSNPTRSPVSLPGPSRAGAGMIHVKFPMDIFVKFEVWNLKTQVFEPAIKMPVDLMDSNRVLADKLVDTGTTDIDGFTHFAIAEADLKQKSGEDKPDLYFNARPKGMTIGGVSLPDEWSTEEWKDVSGKPGYFPNTAFVAGGSLAGATAAAPLVYRIGIDFHLRFEYVGPTDGETHRAPKGLLVGFLGAGDYSEDHLVSGRTDANGEFHGLTFEIEGGQHTFVKVEFNVEDPSINLPEATADTDEATADTPGSGGPWLTSDLGNDKKIFPASTSVGTQGAPKSIVGTENGRNVALFFLTMVYEHTSFFFHITGGAWTGISGLEMIPRGVGDSAYSWPVGTVHITKDWWGDRGTLIHELSHQVMWKECGISSWDVVEWVIDPQGLCLSHYLDMLSNWVHAVMEGWAEVFEGIFEPSSYTFDQKSKLRDGTPLGPPPLNQGLSVEGAFAGAVISVFKSYVVGAVSSNPTVPRTVNGDVTSTAPWIENKDVQKRFLSAIWGPLHAVKSDKPGTEDFIESMRALNPGAWPYMANKMNDFNIAMFPPQIVSISPTSGPAAGGQQVTIEGYQFYPGNTQVTIGGKPVTSLVSLPNDQNANATNENTINGSTPPGTPGKADVVVTTSAGSATLTGGYTFISALPTITFISPASGLVSGGTLVVISGTNFDPANTQVTFGGNAVTQFLSGPEDPTTTIHCNTPAGSGGIVDVVVTTSAGSTTRKSAFEYKYPTSSADQ